MKFDITKAQIIDARHGLSFFMSDRKHSSHGNLSTLFQTLGKIFTHKKNNIFIGNEKIENEFINDVTEKRDDETRSLQQLENRANAARKTDAYDQYEWLNKSDE